MPNKKIILIGAIVILLLIMSTQKSNAETLIAFFEGKRLKAYRDLGFVWTIGFGSTYNFDAKRPVIETDIIDDETALRWLRLEIATRQANIKSLLQVPYKQNELDAMTSLAFNIGSGAFQRSTLLKMFNAKYPKNETALQFLRWDKIKGLYSDGLHKRREKELELFLK
jgi:lysozyme